MSDISHKTSGFGIGELGQVPESAPIDAAAITFEKSKLVLCDCGHAVPRSWVMQSSRGTACPDCYDELSD
jgi:hypothetical protein